MGNHFCEQDKHGISRRTALQGLLGGAALGIVPDVAKAVIEEFTDEQQLEIYIENIKEILHRMNPITERVPHWLNTNLDGTFELFIRGKRSFLPFTGDGRYEVSISGYPVIYDVYETQRLNMRGEPMFTEYLCYQVEDGVVLDDPRAKGEINIIRKLGSVAP